MAERRRNRQSSPSLSQRQSSKVKRNSADRLYPDLGRYRSIDNDDNDDNVSYESSHSGSSISPTNSTIADSSLEKSKQTIRSHDYGPLSWLRLLCTCVVLLLIALLYSVYTYQIRNNVEEDNILKRYKQEVVKVLRENFTKELNETNTKTVLRLVGEKWVVKEPTEPYVVLIAGTKANTLADALVNVFFKIKKNGGQINRIFCNMHKERQFLETEIRNSLSKSNKMVILHGIQKLRGNAPLCLHSLCDSDHSPFPSALILLTIDHSFGPYPICEDSISSYLLNEWISNDIGEDQIRPILSRIFSYVICLED